MANSYRRSLGPQLAARLNETRRLLGISYRRLAAEAHISLGHAHGIVSGVRCPSRPVAVRVARALRFDPTTAGELMREAVDPYDDRPR
jgi:hypothetical protein